jgi:hypothetical protein
LLYLSCKKTGDVQLCVMGSKQLLRLWKAAVDFEEPAVHGVGCAPCKLQVYYRLEKLPERLATHLDIVLADCLSVLPWQGSRLLTKGVQALLFLCGS